MAKVSIILPSFNSASFIYEAVLSILKQSYKNFELIIVDDKSTDETIKIIKLFRDKRIRLIVTKNKLGLASCLNLGIKHSASQFVARMDSDDISETNRLEEQINFLNKNKNIDVVGTAIKIIDEEGIVKRFVSFPKTDLEIKWAMCLGCPIAHPSIMMRRDVFSKYGTYDTKEKIEDYALWTKFLNKGVKFYNLDQHLLKIRKHKRNSKKYESSKLKKIEIEIIKKNIYNILNLKITQKKYIDYIDALRSNGRLKNKYTKEALNFLRHLFFKFRKMYFKSSKNNILDTINKNLLEKIFIIRIRNLKNCKIFIAFILDIILNFKFTIYLFFKVLNNYYKKLSYNIKSNLDFIFRF